MPMSMLTVDADYGLANLVGSCLDSSLLTSLAYLDDFVVRKTWFV